LLACTVAVSTHLQTLSDRFDDPESGRSFMRRGLRVELGCSLSRRGMHQRTRPLPSDMSSG